MERLIDSDELPSILESELPKIAEYEVKTALNDLAITTAAVGLAPTQREREAVAFVARCLGVADDPAALDERVRYFKR